LYSERDAGGRPVDTAGDDAGHQNATGITVCRNWASGARVPTVGRTSGTIVVQDLNQVLELSLDPAKGMNDLLHDAERGHRRKVEM